MSDAADGYRDAYLGDYGFEASLVAWRRRCLADRLARLAPRVVLEVGCGPELLYREHVARTGAVDAWIAVEPVADWAAAADASGLPNLRAVHGLLETSAGAIAAALPAPPDVIVCSHVLQQVADPQDVLARLHALLAPGGTLLLLVANQDSVHRRLAVAMGRIDAPGALSERNRRGLQHRNYDLASLTRELAAAGFAVRAQGGHTVKPFTNAQMAAIAPLLGEDVLEGLYRLGCERPDLACELFVEAVHA